MNSGMSGFTRGIVFAAVALCVTVGTTGGARADDPTRLANELATIPYGAPIKLFQKYVSDRITDEYRPLIKSERNAVKRDQLKREVPEKIAAVESTYTEFTGQKTGFDISVLAGEFRHNANDSLMQEGSDRYYLFNNGRLWKIVKTLEPQTDFSTYALKLATVFGGPDAMEFRDVGGFRPPLRVRWRIEDRMVELSDRRAEYGCYTLVIAKADLWKERSGDRANLAGGSSGVSDKVRELTSEGTGGKEVSDIVDQILDTEPAPKADNKPAGGDGLAPR